MNILFMCANNSERSQIAELIAKNLLGDSARVQSAGSSPTAVDPSFSQVMEEVDLRPTNAKAKTIDQLSTHFIDNLDYAILLCDELVPPIFTAPEVKILRWSLRPTGYKPDISDLRTLRDDLRTRLQSFCQDVKTELDARAEVTA